MLLKWHSLRDKVFMQKNLYFAFRHVKSNKGKAGLDRVSIRQFESDLDVNITNIHNKLKTEIYNPKPVLRVFIPKNRFEKRPLGIPTVSDRIVQQAFRQIIEPIFEKDFSDNSFGFRPGRSCHQAIARVEQYKQEGYHYILDADIKAFYDTIPHELIIDKLHEKIADGWVLRSVRKMLKAGIMQDGVMYKTTEGTPQGGVLSPLLANLVGDIIDKELENAGYKFVRYADDFIIMTKTKEELPAALSFVRQIIEEKLKTVINKVNPVIRGNVNYFRLGDMQKIYRSLDCWIRMRLRCFKFHRKWRTDNKRFQIRRFYRMGLISFEDYFLKVALNT